MRALLAAVLLIVFISIAASGFPDSSQHYHKIFLKNRAFVPGRSDAFLQAASSSQQGEGFHGIVSLGHIPSVEERAGLEKSGIRLLEYIPDSSWLAYISGGAHAVSYIGRLLPADKVSKRLSGIMGKQNVNVIFFSDVELGRMEGIAGQYGNATRQTGNVFEVSPDKDGILRLAESDEVQWIEPAAPAFRVNNDGARADAGVDAVQAAPYGLNGTNVTVAMWDSGYANHSDYNPRTTIGDPGEASTSSHATHVAGTILGDGRLSQANSGSPFQWKGMAPNATLITYKWPTTLSELLNEANASVAVYNAVISSNSWGYDVNATGCGAGMGDYDLFTSAYDKLVRGDRDSISRPITIVFSAGNERGNAYCNQVAMPYNTTTGPGATAKNIITIGAVNSNDNSMTSFSSWGPTDDGRIKPDVVAPGNQVGGDGGIKSTWTADTYSVLSGTSMSAPVVSGIAALIYQEFRAKHGRDPFPSTLRALLIHTATDLNETGPDFTTGYGLVNATAAINLVNISAQGEYISEGNLTATGSNASYNIYASAGQSLKFTLAWDDYTGSVSAGKELVNDLDLVVLNSTGGRFYPWTLDPTQPGLRAVQNRSDSTNTGEVVYVANANEGVWTIRVNAASLPQPPQTFSLVSSNDMAGIPAVTLDSPQDGYVGQRSVNFTCSASASAGLKNMTLYTSAFGSFLPNATRIVSGTQNSSSWSMTSMPEHAFKWNCLAYNVNSVPGWSSNRTFTVDAGPSWMANASQTPAGYSLSTSIFNITWNATLGLSAVYLEGNWSGQAQNYSMQNVSANYSYSSILPAGNFYWKSYASSVNGIWNQTPAFTFIIAKAQSIVTLLLNGTAGNISVAQNASVNITASIPVSGNVTIYVNGAQQATGLSQLTNIALFPSAGAFNITAAYAGNQNYSSNSTTYYAHVNDTQPPSISMPDAFPPLILPGQNFTVTANVTDNVNVTSVAFNITNSTFSLNGTLSGFGSIYNASINSTGLGFGFYNVTIIARDGSANAANATARLSISRAVSLNLTTEFNSSVTSIQAIRILYRGRAEIYNQSAGNATSLNATLPSGMWDAEIVSSFNITIYGINASTDSALSIRVAANASVPNSQLPSGVRAFVKTVAAETGFSFSTAGINISYNASDFVNPGRIASYACHNWSMQSMSCLSSFVNVSANSSFDAAKGIASIASANLSAFAVAEYAICGDGVIDPGESCDSGNLNGQTCAGRGYASGALSCGQSCTFVESGCISAPTTASSSGSGGGGGGGGGTTTQKAAKNVRTSIFFYPTVVHAAGNATFEIIVHNTGPDANVTLAGSCGSCEFNISPQGMLAKSGESNVSITVYPQRGFYGNDSLALVLSVNGSVTDSVSVALIFSECASGTECSGNIFRACSNGRWVIQECANGCGFSGCSEQVCSDGESKCDGSTRWTCEQGEWQTQACDSGCDSGKCVVQKTVEARGLAMAGFAMVMIMLLMLVYGFWKFESAHRRHRSR